MKTRWDVVTIIFTVLLVINTFLNWGNENDIVTFFMGIGDLFVVLVIFSVIGIFCPGVHRFSVLVLILARSAWIILQIELVKRGEPIIKENFDYSAWQSNFVIRVVTPTCMLFLPQFDVFLYLILPL